MMKTTYLPFGAYGVTLDPVPAVAPPHKPVRFELLRAGVTEFLTEDGLLVQLRVNVKAIRRNDGKSQIPYDVDIDLVPTVQPALQVDPYDGPNFAAAYAPVGKKGN